MKQLLCVVFFLLSGFPFLQAGEQKDTISFCVMTYNVENLFDCRHDTLKNDYEFLPTSLRHWNRFKYYKKLNAVARVITAVGKWNPPALVALCEVENDSVLIDLTRHSILRSSGYRYLMTHSADERGIDVALLYQRGLFKPIYRQDISIPRPHPGNRPTRDILHVSGLLLNGDTLDVFVCHFPSRSQGTKRSEPYRLSAARRLKSVTDSLIRYRQHPQIIIMGDFNDYPTDKSIRKVLQADIPFSSGNDTIHSCRLYHLLARRFKTQKYFGSHKYQGEWGLLDHIIVSGSLLQTNSPLHTEESKCDVFSPSFLLTEDHNYGGTQPFRTYYGMKYQGGYSDHLPVFAEFQLLY